MLEIRGAYSKNENTGTLKVLAQFDNGILHIWHQSDPFYLLFSCSDFSITASRTDKTGCIRLNTGGWIETNDIENLELIKQNLKETDQKKIKKILSSQELILMLSLLFLFFAIWIIAQKGG